jgi:hypothetical protein
MNAKKPCVSAKPSRQLGRTSNRATPPKGSKARQQAYQRYRQQVSKQAQPYHQPAGSALFRAAQRYLATVPFLMM